MKRTFMKLVALVIAAATILSLCVPAFAYSVKYIRTTATAYIRKEPDKESKSYGTASKGDVFAYDRTATDDRGVKWYGIIYGSKGTAWISSKNCKKISDSDAKGKSTKTSTKYIRTTGTCYIRKEADKESKSYGTASKGDVFAYDRTSTDSRGVKWYGVIYGSKGTAWISSKNCEKISESEAKGKSTKTSTKYIRTTGTCYIRKAADKESKSYGTASKGEIFSYNQTATDSRGVTWYGIIYGSKGTAWISSKNCEKISESEAKGKSKSTSTATPKATATPRPIDYSKFTAVDQYMIVTGGSVNLRKEPSTDRKSLGSYSKGAVLRATATNGSWYQVVDEEKNVTGYMSADFLEVTETTDEAAVESFEALQALASGVALIDAPEGAANVIYSFIDDGELQIAEIVFDYEGASFTLAAAFAVGTENVFEDMGNELTIMDTAYITEDGDLANVYHFDEENSTQYKLSGPAIMNGSVVATLAETIFAA